LRASAFFLLLAACAAAGAGEFRAVAEAVAVLYDAPSRAAKPLWVVSKHYPLEVLTTVDAWVKVRDHTGTLSWAEKKALSERRTVLVTAPLAEVRARPEDGAPVVFSAAQHVVLELLEIGPGGWLRVRHADGAGGYVRANLVWGA